MEKWNFVCFFFQTYQMTFTTMKVSIRPSFHPKLLVCLYWVRARRQKDKHQYRFHYYHSHAFLSITGHSTWFYFQGTCWHWRQILGESHHGQGQVQRQAQPDVQPRQSCHFLQTCKTYFLHLMGGWFIFLQNIFNLVLFVRWKKRDKTWLFY